MAAARQKEMKLSITVVAMNTGTGERLVCCSSNKAPGSGCDTNTIPQTSTSRRTDDSS